MPFTLQTEKKKDCAPLNERFPNVFNGNYRKQRAPGCNDPRKHGQKIMAARKSRKVATAQRKREQGSKVVKVRR